MKNLVLDFLFQIGAVGFAVVVVEKLGRKILLTTSGFLMCISMCGLGVFFYVDENNSDQAANLGWLPLVCLMVYVLNPGFNKV